ncbi:MAG: peptide chain release factor N(5)-glutamine methyltransferase [Limnohabitans sp.]|jgi:release factor glutamine methyltransferase|uniref:peptide chain release factor N(5)-glutamine methyltransferase n=1 Tax=Limnohabitans sp. TaxID=1907725 RepID=UPI0025D07D65|nr:peptide chain release factor N(5)-glutamine methyltransferase [Limnohabitans sp.]MCO4089450.1 peptide chain release factor N(5)-glutamine methyltransferase [Limnohabitans sp.]
MDPRASPSVADCLQQAHRQGLARVDAQMLLLHALARPVHERAWLLAHDTDLLTEAQQHNWGQALQRRLQGEPVAYITGHKDFFGLTLKVDARVLDPRPDTEILVEWALELLPSSQPTRVLDLGTGSGAVALALQHHRPAAQVTAVDASADALAVASANAQRLNLAVKCVISHWMDAVPGPFELIVSNPPYVAEGDPHLAALTHEPLSALTSGTDGLDDILQIIAQAPSRLAPGGWLLLEHGWDQAAPVQALLREAGFVQVQSRRDLGGLERCTGAVMPK